MCFPYILLGGCSRISDPNNDKSHLFKREISNPIKQNIDTSSNSNSNKKIVNHSKPPLSKDRKWVQLGHQLFYLQGMINTIQKNHKGKYELKISVEKIYQSGAAGAQSPYIKGKTYTFLIKSLPVQNFTGKRVIIYGGQVTSNEQDSFDGAKILYYELHHQYFDLNGKKAALPPKEYPYEF